MGGPAPSGEKLACKMLPFVLLILSLVGGEYYQMLTNEFDIGMHE